MAEAGQAAVYQGGFHMDLHRMLGVQSGSEVQLGLQQSSKYMIDSHLRDGYWIHFPEKVELLNLCVSQASQ